MQRDFLAVLLLAAALSLISVGAHAQNAPAAGRPIDFQKDGVRFQIKASIKALPGSPYAKAGNEKTAASLAVKLRISAHAVGSDYYGVNAVMFDTLPTDAAADEKLVWEESRCHQRRGLPKATVMAVEGAIQTDKGRVEIAARPRQLGKLLPPDEISPGSRQPSGTDKSGAFVAYNSATSASRLTVQVKIYSVDCQLGAGAP